MKMFPLLIPVGILLGGLLIAQSKSALASEREKSIHDFIMTDIDGNGIKLSHYRGKVLLIVNVASECGYTPQYKNLVSLDEQYRDEGLAVLGFPANNFGKQEPGTNVEIKEFCTAEYRVTFPMFSKISVRGDDQDPLFKYLTSAENPDFTGDIRWNFEKFLVGKDGELIRRFRSKVLPDSKEVVVPILKALE